MNKKIILFFAIMFEIIGSYIPLLLGEKEIFSLWGVLGGLVGGIFGIWIGVVISKKLS